MTNQRDTITLEEVAAKYRPHPVKMYEHLIDHVQGFNEERAWYQGSWTTRTALISASDWALEVGAYLVSTNVTECGSTACVAGEAVLFAGGVQFGGIRFEGRQVFNDRGFVAGWAEIAEAVGVPDKMHTLMGFSLFHPYRTRAKVLTELHYRHQAALEDAS